MSADSGDTKARVPRVLLASYHFPPSTAVGARRPARLARLLPAFGFDVDVICADVSVSTESSAAGRDEVAIPGDILRVPTPFVFGRNPEQVPAAEALWQTAWRNARRYVEGAVLTAEFSWRWGELAVRQLDPSRSYDMMIVDAPPNPAVVPFIRFAAQQRIPVVLDLRDLWIPECRSTATRWHADPWERRRRWKSRLADEAIEKACRVVVVSEGMLPIIRDYFPDRPPQDFSYVPNAYTSVDEVKGGATRSLGQPLRVVYTGSLAYGRDAQAMDLIRAMGLLRRERGTSVVHLTVAGLGGEGLLEAAELEGVADSVEVRGWMTEDEAVELQRDADALLLLQPSDRTEIRVAIPAKLFEYMARRRHILGMLGPGPAAKLIEEHNLGTVVSTGDPGRIALAITELESRVRQTPILVRPPDAYSEAHTVAAFAGVLNEIVEKSCSHPAHLG